MKNGRHILVGICGSIAAYKSAFLVRQFIERGDEVKVVMTPAATEFITPLTLSTLSKNPVVVEFADEKSTWNNHVELGLWADLFIIAPASANTMAKMAAGICDNLLLTTYLSAKCPVAVAPASRPVRPRAATSDRCREAANAAVRSAARACRGDRPTPTGR